MSPTIFESTGRGPRQSALFESFLCWVFGAQAAQGNFKTSKFKMDRNQFSTHKFEKTHRLGDEKKVTNRKKLPLIQQLLQRWLKVSTQKMPHIC